MNDIFKYKYVINKDLNICFLSGTIISEPDFDFFFNSKKLLSKVSFYIKTEEGFSNSQKSKSEVLNIVAYNENADVIYKEANIGDKIIIKGFLETGRIVIDDFIKVVTKFPQIG